MNNDQCCWNNSDAADSLENKEGMLEEFNGGYRGLCI